MVYLMDAISMQSVNKWFDSFHALNDINFATKKGEKVVVCGPSGSGKSTLIRCLNGLELHTSGTIDVLGIRLLKDGQSLRKIRENIGMVFQQFNLFPHLTVIENCTLAPITTLGLSPAEATERAMKYLDRVKIADQAHKLPKHLSGGQQQRVAIARSLCLEPKIMLFDEPTSALDPETINEVLDTMISLAEDGMSMICVTHELAFARKIADRIIFMDQGQIIDDQPPEEFFLNPGSERAKEFISQILTH
ncbi:MAG: ABC transporter ATP-binding protein [Oceanospirillaceae bacterium]|nr:ABC transporter ATP-binding protein [Oceanospirillaceae bacterium]